jgi:uncharacterized protein YhbP (UPF0306 family)
MAVTSQLRDVVKQYAQSINIMQLATSVNDQPWACTVHYYSDEDLNFYWVSTLVRKHSQDIAQNPKVAAAILVHENTVEERYVIGISIEGKSELIGENVATQIGQNYIQKLGRDQSLLSDIATGKNPHKFYKLTPTKIVLFDSKNFPENPRQEMVL